ncbi:hypothetical protein CBF37_05825 [Vagococcus vulneris]|uniref:CsbD-like domain-containing protein n=2 Tax=Vagococcus vulneris TaxID=1977869 RepID=A0A429ZYH5_9ENTE|nr:hypothetical protein CBF37_05825 [Vagococcus vulneris]
MRVEGALNQVTGASKEVAHDIAHHTTKFVDKVLGAGSSNQVKGQAEEFIGKTTDNHMKQAEGKFDQAIGKTQAFTSDAKDKILPGEKHPKHK